MLTSSAVGCERSILASALSFASSRQCSMERHASAEEDFS